MPKLTKKAEKRVKWRFWVK